jgi:hypothetical protein
MGYRFDGDFRSALLGLGERMLGIVTGLCMMLLLIAIGLVVGWLARLIVTRLARAVEFDRHTERWGLATAFNRSGILRTPSDILATLCFWVIFIFFASVGIDSLGFPGAEGATAFLVAFLPTLFAALLIVVVGWLVANFVSQGLLIAAVNAGIPEARLLARAVHWGVLLFACATALTHLGIGKEMVLVAFGITFGGLVLALALAFGLGGRGLARDILARRLRRDAPPDRERLSHL